MCRRQIGAARVQRQFLRKSQPVYGLPRLLAQVAPGHPSRHAIVRQDDIFPDRQVIRDRGFLRDDPDPGGNGITRGKGCRVLSVDGQGATAARGLAADDPGKRGFSGPVCAKKGMNLAGKQGEVGGFERADMSE